MAFKLKNYNYLSHTLVFLYFNSISYVKPKLINILPSSWHSECTVLKGDCHLANNSLDQTDSNIDAYGWNDVIPLWLHIWQIRLQCSIVCAGQWINTSAVGNLGRALHTMHTALIVLAPVSTSSGPHWWKIMVKHYCALMARRTWFIPKVSILYFFFSNYLKLYLVLSLSPKSTEKCFQ